MLKIRQKMQKGEMIFEFEKIDRNCGNRGGVNMAITNWSGS